MNGFSTETLLREQHFHDRDPAREVGNRRGEVRLSRLEGRTSRPPPESQLWSARDDDEASSSGQSSSIEIEELFETLLKNLLPGLSDRVTIQGILTKVSWSTLCTLATVSRAWRHTIQNGRVSETRNYKNSTKTLVVVSHRAPEGPSTFAGGAKANLTKCGRSVPANWRYALSLYDPGDNVWHRLPPIPGVTCGVPKFCGCQVLNGKLYVIGGDDYDTMKTRREVHMMDLAACKGVWVSCASMQSPRSEFQSELENGKIYVLGGGYQSEIHYSNGVEVFDPKRNQWQTIESMRHPRSNHTVVALEGKLYVLGGTVWLEEEDDILYQNQDCDEMFDSTLHAKFAEVYDPRKKTWGRVENITKKETDDAFVMVHGKLHVLRPDSVHVYDVISNSWIFLQHISWEVQATVGAKDCCIRVARYVDGELVALVGRTREDEYGLMLLRSKNFARRNCEITWEAIPCFMAFDTESYSLCTIQL